MQESAIIGGFVALGMLIIAVLTLVINNMRSNYSTFATKSEVNQVLGQQTVDKVEITKAIEGVEKRLTDRLGRIEDKIDKHISRNGG